METAPRDWHTRKDALETELRHLHEVERRYLAEALAGEVMRQARARFCDRGYLDGLTELSGACRELGKAAARDLGAEDQYDEARAAASRLESRFFQPIEGRVWPEWRQLLWGCASVLRMACERTLETILPVLVLTAQDIFDRFDLDRSVLDALVSEAIEPVPTKEEDDDDRVSMPAGRELSPSELSVF